MTEVIAAGKMSAGFIEAGEMFALSAYCSAVSSSSFGMSHPRVAVKTEKDKRIGAREANARHFDMDL